MRIQEEIIELQKKIHKKICVRDITFLSLFSYILSLSSTLILHRKKNFTPENGGGGSGGGGERWCPGNKIIILVS